MTITQGLGYGLANLFTDSGSRNVEDYKLGYFQLGQSTASGLGNDIYELSSALVFASSYGSATPFIATSLDQIVKIIDSGIFVTSSHICARLGPQTTTNMAIGFFRTLISLRGSTPEPGLSIQELGLFMKNPDGKVNEDKPVMVAYTYFNHPITTATDLGIILDWIITFEGS